MPPDPVANAAFENRKFRNQRRKGFRRNPDFADFFKRASSQIGHPAGAGLERSGSRGSRDANNLEDASVGIGQDGREGGCGG